MAFPPGQALANLKEMFPQVDHRILRGALFEHNNNVEEVIDYVFCEVIPEIESISLKDAKDGERAASEICPTKLDYEEEADVHVISNKIDQHVAGVDKFGLKGSGGVCSLFPVTADGGENVLHQQEDNDGALRAVLLPNEEIVDTTKFVWMESVEQGDSPCPEVCSDKVYGDPDVGNDSGHCGICTPASSPKHAEHSAEEMHKIDDVNSAETEDMGGNLTLIDTPEENLVQSSLSMSAEQLDDSKCGIDGNDESWSSWSTASGKSLHLPDVDSLDYLVAQGKASNESLRLGIQQVQGLRAAAEAAESVARQALLDASQGFPEVSSAEQLRVSRINSKEKLETYKFNVIGEKHFLVGEVSQFQERMVQLEKQKKIALHLLADTKAELEDRIAQAKARQASAEDLRKANKLLAVKQLEEEQRQTETVEKEWRTVEAVEEECNKLQRFLKQQGTVVDALQGDIGELMKEVAALKESVAITLSDGEEVTTGSVKSFRKALSNGKLSIAKEALGLTTPLGSTGKKSSERSSEIGSPVQSVRSESSCLLSEGPPDDHLTLDTFDEPQYGLLADDHPAALSYGSQNLAVFETGTWVHPSSEEGWEVVSEKQGPHSSNGKGSQSSSGSMSPVVHG